MGIEAAKYKFSASTLWSEWESKKFLFIVEEEERTEVLEEN